MSSPEALAEYEAEHADDVETVRQKLRSHDIDPDRDDIQTVLGQLNNMTTASVQGPGFTVFRDFENHFDVHFDNESEQAA